jgi:hypothetical protein
MIPIPPVENRIRFCWRLFQPTGGDNRSFVNGFFFDLAAAEKMHDPVYHYSFSIGVSRLYDSSIPGLDMNFVWNRVGIAESPQFRHIQVVDVFEHRFSFGCSQRRVSIVSKFHTGSYQSGKH